MAYTQPNNFYFPQYPSPPFHPFNPPPSPSHSFYPPPPPSFRPPHPPPSPIHPIVPPPPHRFPPPAPVPVPVPPSPSPNNHPIVIVIVVVSMGGLMLLSLLAFAICCSIKKSKKKSRETETDIVRVDEHKEIKETIVTDPFGKQAVVISVEDDVHIEEEIAKNKEKVGHSLHAESHQEMDNIHVDEHKRIKETIVADPFGQKAVGLSIEDDFHMPKEKTKNDENFGQNLHATEDQGNSSSTDAGTSSSDHQHQQIEDKL